MKENITVKGAVQGIGYRPFTAFLAEKLHIGGTVQNCGGIVKITAEGTAEALDYFARALREEAPAGAIVLAVKRKRVSEETAEDGTVNTVFRIIPSGQDREDIRKELPVFPPDLAMCEDCRREMEDPKDRRYRYPLISCASCGPRFSILKAFPYDRETTVMEDFPMCPSCAAEYRHGRRRHAQTISCHDCGPQMLFSGPEEIAPDTGEAAIEASGESAVQKAETILRGGGILALKGIGGYQLVCSPYNERAVQRLRRMKGREKKPFAVLFPDVESVRRYASLSETETALLTSSARPIVLAERIAVQNTVLPAKTRDKEDKENPQSGQSVSVAFEDGYSFAPSVCSDSRFLGAFLPCVGIQRLLTEDCGPLIVTSANRSGSPIPFRDEDFFGMLTNADITPDGVLWHKRRILRPLDDSVVYAEGTSARMIRRSRGYVPLPVFLKEDSRTPVILAMGGDLKASFAVRRNSRVILSQYFGDLSDYAALQNYRDGIREDTKLFAAKPELICCDLHPGYASGRLGREIAGALGIPVQMIQHHHAHIASVMAEHGLTETVGIAFDGTGCGTDGQLWGGEFLLCRDASFERKGSLAPILLTGGDAASVHADLVADAYRVSIGERAENPLVAAALRSGVNTITSTSAGRLFDAVSCLLGIRKDNNYEGACAIALENAAARALERHPGVSSAETEAMSFLTRILGRCSFRRERKDGFRELLQTDLVRALLQAQNDTIDGTSGDGLQNPDNRAEDLALAFHLVLAVNAAEIAARIAQENGVQNISFSGGVFQNRILSRALGQFVRERGFRVYLNEQVPAGDGGIALGQAYLAGMKEF